MNKPLIIGIPAEAREFNNAIRNNVNQPDVAAIVKAGGVPIMIPTREPKLMASYIDLLDGLLIPGGPDVAPRFYVEEPHPKLGDTDALLDESGIQLVKLAVERNIPIMGICRGLQVINVALGGSLYQDIESQIDHPVQQHFQKAPMDQGTQHVSVEDDSLLSAALNGASPILVNSHHHQAVKKVSQALKVTATANDGVIEAVETRQTDLIAAVQWHPETMFQNNDQQMALFTSFMNRVAKWRQAREDGTAPIKIDLSED